MESIIFESKLKPPACSHLVGRERLLAEMAGPDSNRITVVIADAGYGKTTLMSQAFDLSGDNAIWYQFDELDRDVSVFMNHLAVAISRIFPKEGKSLQAIISGADSMEEAKDGWISSLANSFDSNSGKRLFLFLDDFHVINDNMEVIELIRFMTAHLSEKCRLIIGARKKPNISLGRLRAQRQILDLDTTDLTFTLSESRELFDELCPVELGDETIQSWHRVTEGWPIAMVMAAAVIDENSRETDEVLSSLMLSSGSISEFLVEEIWKSMGENMKQMLMEASLLYEVDTGVLDRANRDREELIPANSFFQDAVERHLMTTCLISNGKYRLHELFKKFLREKLEATYGPADIAELHGRYARAFAEAGETEQSIDHYFKAGQIDAAARLLDQSGDVIFQEGKIDTVAQWMKLIPDANKEKSPRLYLLDARVLEYQGDIEKGLGELGKAQKLFEESGQRDGLYLCEFTRSGYLTAIEEYEKALEAAEVAMGLADSDADAVDAMNRMATLKLLLGSVDNAMSLWDEAVRRFDDVTGKITRRVAIPQISGKFYRGDYKAVLNDTEAFFKLDNPPEVLRERFVVLFLRAKVLMKLCRYQQSLDVLEKAGLFLGEEYGRYYRQALDIIMGHDYLYVGREKEGLKIIGRFTGKGGSNKIYGPDSEYTYLGAYYRRKLDFVQAVSCGRLAMAEMDDSRRLLGRTSAHFNLGASLMRLNGPDDKKAHKCINEAYSWAESSGYNYVLTQVHFYRAWERMQLGDKQRTLEEIGKSLDIASRNWHNHFIAQEGRISMDLLSLAYEHDIQADYLLDIFSIIGPEATQGLAHLLESEDSHIRGNAVKAIAAAGGVSAAPMIYKLLRDKDKQVKEAAKTIMSRLRDEIRNPEEVLTNRESEVLICVAEGISNAEIAERLYISEPTVKTHITRIFQKLGVTKRTQAAAFYHQRKAQAG